MTSWVCLIAHLLCFDLQPVACNLQNKSWYGCFRREMGKWGIRRRDTYGVHSAADIMRNYDDKVSKLLDAGIDVLIYVGVGEPMLQTS